MFICAIILISSVAFIWYKEYSNHFNNQESNENTNNNTQSDNKKTFSLKTNEVLLEINKQYNLLDYIELKNMELSDLNIFYDKNYISIENNQLLIKDDISQTNVKFSYEDIQHELIINVENNLRKCSYIYDESNDITSYLENCDSLFITYDNIKMNFQKNSNTQDDIRHSVKISNEKNTNIIEIDGIYISGADISKLNNIYLVEIYSFEIFNCSLPQQIFLFDSDGTILKDITSTLTAEEEKEYSVDSAFKIIKFDYDNNHIIEEFDSCGLVACGTEQYKIQKIYEYKNDTLVLLENKKITYKNHNNCSNGD